MSVPEGRGLAVWWQVILVGYAGGMGVNDTENITKPTFYHGKCSALKIDARLGLNRSVHRPASVWPCVALHGDGIEHLVL